MQHSLVNWIGGGLTLVCLTGCGGGPGSGMPPADPLPVQRQNTQAGREGAEKLLAVARAKDSTTLDSLNQEMQKSLGAAIHSADRDSEQDFGRLMGMISLMKQGEWDKAEQHLQSVVENSAKSEPAAEAKAP